MKQMRRQRPHHPRIECSVPGCERGSTYFEPGTRFICGRCWRRAPQDIRVSYTRWRRKFTAAERRGDERAINAYGFQVGRAWERVLRLLTAEAETGTEVPALMAEQLRKDGLL